MDLVSEADKCFPHSDGWTLHPKDIETEVVNKVRAFDHIFPRKTRYWLVQYICYRKLTNALKIVYTPGLLTIYVPYSLARMWYGTWNKQCCPCQISRLVSSYQTS